MTGATRQTRLLLCGGLMGVALLAAVPSRAAFHPFHSRTCLSDDDITGSGYEISEAAVLVSGATRDESLVMKVARQWHDLARRARRLAVYLEGSDRQTVLDRADEYEDRARRLETPRRGEQDST